MLVGIFDNNENPSEFTFYNALICKSPPVTCTSAGKCLNFHEKKKTKDEEA